MYIRTGQGFGEDTGLVPVENLRRAIREAHAKLETVCQGVDVLKRLRKQPVDVIAEGGRLRTNLENARRSGDARKIAQAECELAHFNWDSVGDESIRKQYDAIVRKIRSKQSALSDARWWLNRWRCSNWPANVPQPAKVKQNCQKQVAKIKGLETELEKMKKEQEALEDMAIRKGVF